MGPDILVPATIFGSVVLIVWVIVSNRTRRNREVLETVRSAIQSGQQMTPETIRALGVERKKKGGDIRWGIILVSIALAFVSLGYTIGSVDGGDAEEAFVIMTGVAAFPGFVGVALIIMGVFMRDKSNDDDA
ncbi:DUF6249 domain-containing protein [Hyphobacterium marinum]|uniref:DUF6249 domain-containing protein n=1 Tax=Hyphobacterium marinum TaxID=3116574 RepID=A0ABU7M015_9PROT|nr:DUF6249 domain-containing protein [Hyphobacterium sp. Y6023]MEE2567161.1 DUF6249 domain-containing protein [Hyphobacterium sp. Y6023]